MSVEKARLKTGKKQVRLYKHVLATGCESTLAHTIPILALVCPKTCETVAGESVGRPENHPSYLSWVQEFLGCCREQPSSVYGKGLIENDPLLYPYEYILVSIHNTLACVRSSAAISNLCLKAFLYHQKML